MKISLVSNREVASAARDLVPTSKKPLPFTNCKGGFPVMAETTRNNIFFKRNQSSDNRSHGFGAKFLLKKLSASDFSYERKPALR